MRENAGERLFQAMGQIPDDMILEAAAYPMAAGKSEQEQTDKNHMPQAKTGKSLGTPAKDGEPAESAESAANEEPAESEANGDSMEPASGEDKLARWKVPVEKLGGYLKYLPVVACLCIVFGGAGYIVSNFKMGSSAPPGIHMGGYDSGGMHESGEGGIEKDMALEDATLTDDSSAQAQENGMQFDSGTGGVTDGEEEKSSEQKDAGADGAAPGILPRRYDAYEGPVFALTATGDMQNLKVTRSLKAAIKADPMEKAGGQEAKGEEAPPLLQVTDTYQIKNTSNSDKTLQIVYPFVTTFGQKPDASGQVLSIKGEPQIPVSYSIGESILAYQDTEQPQTSTMEDYEQIFNAQTDYQEQALEKEAGWNQKVQVYTFSDIRLREGAEGVVGVTVSAKEAEVLTYGFDHSFGREDGSSNHCFFLPDEPEKLVLIVAGEQEAEPQVGYYSNLDCVERLDMDNLEYEMHSQEMSYANALRICSNDAAGQLREDLTKAASGKEAAPYVNAEALLRALTMISEEDSFYDTLKKRYQSTELKEVFERIFGETRVVYAKITVTIPAKESIQAVAQIQKHKQKQQEGKEYSFDFFHTAQSGLPLKKTDFRLELDDGWTLAQQDMGLEQKKASVWKAALSKKAYSFSVCFESETYENKD
ncbi:MAG: hypothetical protein K2N87_02620 [Eubacterium sp.]|nr:hypothetical protein [Eubacterium sp.]